MILKIQGLPRREGWIIYDNIKYVNYEYVRRDKIRGKVDVWFEGLDEERLDLCAILVMFNDGSNKLFALKIASYLLNDEGKTIEKLY